MYIINFRRVNIDQQKYDLEPTQQRHSAIWSRGARGHVLPCPPLDPPMEPIRSKGTARAPMPLPGSAYMRIVDKSPATLILELCAADIPMHKL